MGVMNCSTCGNNNNNINNINLQLTEPPTSKLPPRELSQKNNIINQKLNFVQASTKSIKTACNPHQSNTNISSIVIGERQQARGLISQQSLIITPLLDENKGSIIQSDQIGTLLTKNERKQLLKILSSHFLFHNILNELNFNAFLCDKNIKEFQEKQEIFKEGKESEETYIILSGKVELKSSTIDKVIQIGKFSIFGEIAILEKEFYRQYSATALSNNTMLLAFSRNDYKGFIKQSTRYDNSIKTSMRQEIGELITKIKLFSYLDENERSILSKFVYTVNLFPSDNPVTFNETFYLVKKGKIDCNPYFSSFRFEMTDFMFYGITDFLLNNKTIPLNIFPLENTKLFLIPKTALLELFGTNPQYHIIYPYFKTVFLKSKLFSKIFNELQLVPIYQLFKLNQYSYNTIAFSKNDKPKLFIVLDGELTCEKQIGFKGSLYFKFGKVYGDNKLSRNNELDGDIESKYNSIVLECEWSEMLLKIKELKSDIANKIDFLSKVKLFKNLNELSLLEIAVYIKENTFDKGDSIMNKSSYIKDYLYVINEGNVSLFKNKNVICTYDKYDCINEIQNENEEIVAMSENVILYCIELKYYKDLIQNEQKTMKISLDQLYYIDDLTDNEILVHNKENFFIAKICFKTKDLFPKVAREMFCSCSNSLEHPLLIKSCSSLETNKHFILFYKYIEDAITLQTFINEIHCEEKKKEVFIFTASCLFIIINYLHSKRLIHRNITTENIFIDNEGYCRLKDFSISKDMKNKNSTKTLCGVPKFSAPELLKGESYSFSVDFWSIGICLYCVYYHKYPFNNENEPNSLYNEIMNKKLTFTKTSPEVKELLSGLLCKDKKIRIKSFTQIKQISLFKDINFEGIALHKIESPLKLILKNKKKEQYEMSTYSSLKKYIQQYKKVTTNMVIDESNWCDKCF